MITLSRLTEDDLEFIMKCRMSPEIDKMMFTSVKLTMDGQRKWFEKIKNSDKEIRWVIKVDNKPVGSMYFTDIDRGNKRCESGWFVADKSGLQLKDIIALQQNSYDYAFDVLGLNRVYGYVIDSNKGILRLLQCCGIKKEGELAEHVVKDGVTHNVVVVGLTKSQWKDMKENTGIEYPKFEIE